MIARILIIAFTSVVGAVCYLNGMNRLMSALLLAFGSLMAFVFGLLFVLPNSESILGFPVYGQGSSGLFFALAVLLAIGTVLILLKKSDIASYEHIAVEHFKFFAGGLLTSVVAIFLPAFFWFPSEEKRVLVEESALATQAFIGTCFYLVCWMGALYLFYRASRGGTPNRPDLMLRLVLAVFAFFQLDKIPVLIAYLLIYSPETQVVFPGVAAFALASYIPMLFFLWLTTGGREDEMTN